MIKSFTSNRSIRIGLIVAVFYFSIANNVFAQLGGAKYPLINTNYTYDYDGGSISFANWEVSPGVTIVATNMQSNYYSITLNFPAGGTKYVRLRSKTQVVEQTDVIVRTGCSTNPAGTPTGNSTGFYSPGNSATLYMTPGINGDMVLWSNNTNYSETMGGFVTSGNTYVSAPLSAPTTMYAKTVNSATGCQSSNVVVTVNPLQLTTSVKQEQIRVPGVTTNSQIAALTNSEKSIVVSHVDGLGRQKQTVAVQASQSGKDVIVPVDYDAFGRSPRNLAPYTATTNQGLFRASYDNEVMQFYGATNDKVANDTKPFSQALFEASPLGRVIEQGTVGADRQPGTNHTQRVQYTFNDAADNVRLFNEDGSSTQYYAVNLLSKTIVTDPNGNQTIVFADKAGRTILKKQQLGEIINGVSVPFLETYYIYDDMGRTKFIISPKGVEALKNGAWSLTTAIKDNYVFQFVYDVRSRLIEKKTPGQAWMFFGYDNLNRLVLSQDGLLRAQNKWVFIKYDIRNRPVMQGLYLNATQTTRTTIQTLLDGLYIPANPNFIYYESRGTTLHGYNNAAFPKLNANNTALEILAVNYYDDYDFDNNGTADYNYVSQGLPGESSQARAFLLPTGSKKLVLGTANWLWTVSFYDKYKRPIQIRSNNHLRLTVDNLSTSVYDFEGKVLTTKSYHNAGTAVTVINKFTYDDKGRLVQVRQNIDSAPSDQVVAQYEYNELGQLVDKKLHNTGGVNFLQSVDYRYTIQGQLASINNAQLDAASDNNDETTDYFGMEFLFSTVESGLSNTALYNGNISAMKWKGFGAVSGTTDQQSYSLSYDKSNKLKAATYKVRGISSWNKETNAQNESMTYDHNGNILTLTRNQRKHLLQDVVVSYNSETIDNLTYVYNASNGNSLEKVTDAAAIMKGFDNGTSGTNNDYTYDTNGNLTADANKGISTIAYNFLGKPTQITYSDGRVIVYTYDATGNKLKIAVTVSGVTTTTDYVGSFVYENTALKFFGSAEGRVVKNGSTYEYEYAIGDHQGNTRVLFTSATPAAVAPTATFEGDANDGAGQYTNIVGSNVVTFVGANHTSGGLKVVRMNQTYKIGPAKSVKVYPGDKIDMEVWEYHESTSGYGTTGTAISSLVTSVAGVFGGVSGAPGESGVIYNSVNSAFGGFGTGGNQGDARPAAYLNYILLDKDRNLLDAGWQLAPAASFTKQKISFATKDIRQEGYIYVWLSYDDNSNNWVYFDDFKVTHTKSNVLQYNEYYPFGLQTSNSWTRDNSKNQFLYNAGNELNSTTGWYEMFFRGYDPATGRMLQIDPYAASFSSYTPYHYAFDNPIGFNDPSGAIPEGPMGQDGIWDEDKWNKMQSFSLWLQDGGAEMMAFNMAKFASMSFGNYGGGYGSNGPGWITAWGQNMDNYVHNLVYGSSGGSGKSTTVEIDLDALPNNSQTTLYFDGNGGFLGGFQISIRDASLLAFSGNAIERYDDGYAVTPGIARKLVQLHVRMIFHLADAISLGGQLESLAGFGGTIEKGVLYSLQGTSAGEWREYLDSGAGLGLDGGVAINLTEYYYLNLTDIPHDFTINDHNGPRFAMSADVNFYGILSLGAGVSVAPVGLWDSGVYIIGKSISFGIGIEGSPVSGNANLGETKLKK